MSEVMIISRTNKESGELFQRFVKYLKTEFTGDRCSIYSNSNHRVVRLGDIKLIFVDYDDYCWYKYIGFAGTVLYDKHDIWDKLLLISKEAK